MKIISSAKLITIGLVITLFTSCENEDSDRNGMVIGSVHGIISDESSNARLDSVNVYWINNGELQSTQTDSLGYYAISELSTGDYEITFSKDGEFATGTVSVTIPSFQDLESVEHLPKNSDYPYSETQDVELFGLTSELTGLIYKAEDVENITSLILGKITTTLENNGRVEIRGFGSLSVRKRDQKNGRNPRTGESVFVPEKKAPIFKSGKGLRDRLNYKI